MVGRGLSNRCGPRLGGRAFRPHRPDLGDSLDPAGGHGSDSVTPPPALESPDDVGGRMTEMAYVDTLIAVADDCPVSRSVVPTASGGKKTVAMLQYEMLARNPHVRRRRTCCSGHGCRDRTCERTCPTQTWHGYGKSSSPGRRHVSGPPRARPATDITSSRCAGSPRRRATVTRRHRTVENRLQRVYEKLGVHSRAELALTHEA